MSDDDSDGPEKPLRGTGSVSNPFSGESAPEPGSGKDATITIRAPDGSVRVYELTDWVKKLYEDAQRARLESLDVYWYEMWWEGTELVVEWEGEIRDSEIRGDHEEATESRPDMARGNSLMSMLKMQAAQHQQRGLPRQPRPPWRPRRGVAQAGVDVDELMEDIPTVEYFDEGLVPHQKETRFNIQDRADKFPLEVEDIFIRAWDPNDEGQEPINTEHNDGEVDYEIEDFRDHTDDRNTTLPDGARGNRYNL